MLKFLTSLSLLIIFLMSEIDLYYSEDDKPHYQLLSHNKKFVKKYFPNSIIKNIKVRTVKITDFLNNNFKPTNKIFLIRCRGIRL